MISSRTGISSKSSSHTMNTSVMKFNFLVSSLSYKFTFDRLRSTLRVTEHRTVNCIKRLWKSESGLSHQRIERSPNILSKSLNNSLT